MRKPLAGWDDDDWPGDARQDANRDWLDLILTVAAAVIFVGVILCVGFVGLVVWL
jgi:hypothetical protein